VFIRMSRITSEMGVRKFNDHMLQNFLRVKLPDGSFTYSQSYLAGFLAYCKAHTKGKKDEAALEDFRATKRAREQLPQLRASFRTAVKQLPMTAGLISTAVLASFLAIDEPKIRRWQNNGLLPKHELVPGGSPKTYGCTPSELLDRCTVLL